MNSIDIWRLARSSSSSSSMLACTATSSAEVTSSQTRTRGSAASARASATRCFSPPLSVRGDARAEGRGQPHSSSSSATRARLGATAQAMELAHGPPDDLAHAHARIERAVGILEDHLHAAALVARALARRRPERLAVEAGRPRSWAHGGPRCSARASSCRCRSRPRRQDSGRPSSSNDTSSTAIRDVCDAAAPADAPAVARHEVAHRERARRRRGRRAPAARLAQRDGLADASARRRRAAASSARASPPACRRARGARRGSASIRNRSGRRTTQPCGRFHGSTAVPGMPTGRTAPCRARAGSPRAAGACTDAAGGGRARRRRPPRRRCRRT